MAKTPEVIRELRPHAIWSGVEILWRLVGSAVITALAGTLLALRSHLDVLALLGVFIVSFVVLAFGALRRRAPDRTAAAAAELPILPTSALTPAANAPSTSAGKADSPSPLRIEFATEGSKERFNFKTRGRPIVVSRTGDLTCEELYRSEYELNLLARVFPEVDQSTPLECGISGFRDRNTNDSMSLRDRLDCLGPMAVCSIPVVYKVDGRECTDRFFIYKNADGSIVLSLDEPLSRAQDLTALHRRLRLLESARKELPLQGIILFLAQESIFIAKQLRDILQENVGDPKMDLPMKPEIIFPRHEDEQITLSGGRAKLMLFAQRYKWLVDRCDVRGLPSPLAIPNDMHAEPFLLALDAHAEALEKRARDIAAPYERPTRQPSQQPS